MHRKYWLTAAILFAVGLAAHFSPYRFSGSLLCAAALAVAVFGAVDGLKKRLPRAMRWTRRILLGCLAVLLLLTAATGVWVGIKAAGSADPAAEYVVVLGAGVNGTTPSQSLRERLDAALEYMTRYPDAILILSGGKGDRENISEAQCMYHWLTERGADPARLRVEEQASTTEENIAFSLALIEEEFGVHPQKLGVISAEYHLLRASLIADQAEVEAVCYPAHTANPIFFCNMFVREICGVWYTLVTGIG